MNKNSNKLTYFFAGVILFSVLYLGYDITNDLVDKSRVQHDKELDFNNSYSTGMDIPEGMNATAATETEHDLSSSWTILENEIKEMYPGIAKMSFVVHEDSAGVGMSKFLMIKWAQTVHRSVRRTNESRIQEYLSVRHQLDQIEIIKYPRKRHH